MVVIGGIIVLIAMALYASVLVGVVWACYLALCYIVGPGYTYLALKLEARPHFAEVPLHRFPSAARAFAKKVVSALEEQGFEVSACLSRGSSPYGPPAYVVVLENSLTHEVARVTASIPNGCLSLSASFVEICSRFEDGRSLATLSLPVPDLLLHAGHETRTCVPEVKDPRLLLKIHRHLAEASARGRACVIPEGPAAAVLAREMVDSYEVQREKSILCLDEAEALYRPTWNGACFLTWRNLWPVQGVLRGRARREAALRLLAFPVDATSREVVYRLMASV